MKTVPYNSLYEETDYQAAASSSSSAPHTSSMSVPIERKVKNANPVNLPNYATDITRIVNDADFLKAIKSTQDQESALATFLACLCSPLLLSAYCCESFNPIIARDEIGLAVRNGAPILLEPGRHFLPSPITHFRGVEKTNKDLIQFESITILNLRANQRAYLLDNGEYRELDKPGRYFWNSSLCQHLGTYNLNEKVISAGEHGPLRRLIVNQGEVAVIYEEGHLKILKEGIHEITDPTAQYSAHMPTAQVMHKLLPITTMSADGLNLTATAAVFFSISDPGKLITSVGQRRFNDIVDERARIALAEAIRGCHIRDIGTKPRTSSNSSTAILSDLPSHQEVSVQPVDYSRISKEIHDTFMAQLQEEMEAIGIHINLVQLEELKPEDALHRLLAQQATASASAQAAITTAEATLRTTELSALAEARKTQIETEAKANASRITAEANANNRKIEARGEAEAVEALASANASRIKQEGDATAAAITAQTQAFGNDPRLAASVRMVDASAQGIGRSHNTIVSPGTFFALPGMANDMLNVQQAPRQ